MRRPPLAHRVDTTHPYTPAVATDIRRTIAAERKRLAAREARAVAERDADARMKRGIVQYLGEVGGAR